MGWLGAGFQGEVWVVVLGVVWVQVLVGVAWVVAQALLLVV